MRLAEYLIRPPQIAANQYRYYLLGLITSIAGCATHFCWIWLFYYLDVKELFYFNMGSVVLFLALIPLFRSSLMYTGIALATLEIYTHQVLTVYLIGRDAGFEYFILLPPVFTCLLAGRRVAYKIGMGLIGLGCYLFLRFALSDPVYDIDPGIMDALAFMNIVFTFAILVAFALYFNFAVANAEEALEKEHHKVQHLLLNILPASIAERLKAEPKQIADGYENATILFADIVNFTAIASATTPERIVGLLNDIFSRFDLLCEQYGLEKIKTIGDSYMVAAGIPEPREDHADQMAEFAMAMLKELKEFNQATGQNFSIRIGINSGPVVAGVIGKKKFIYDLWGDSVNIASRMQSHGIPGEIHVTEETYRLLQENYRLEERGEIAVKGKGLVRTYLLKKSRIIPRTTKSFQKTNLKVE